MTDVEWAREHSLLMKFAATEAEVRRMYQVPAVRVYARYELSLLRLEHDMVLDELRKANA